MNLVDAFAVCQPCWGRAAGWLARPLVDGREDVLTDFPLGGLPLLNALQGPLP
jgi:hypothetical protein